MHATFLRWQTGNIPNAVVISHAGQQTYVNNEVDVSVAVIDLVNNVVLGFNIPSGEPPAPGVSVPAGRPPAAGAVS